MPYKLLPCPGYNRHVVKISTVRDECVAGLAIHRQNSPFDDHGCGVVLDEVCMCELVKACSVCTKSNEQQG